MFANWISSDNLRSWIAENVSRDSFFCLLLLQQHFCSELLTQMIFVFDVNGFFEFVHTNKRSHRELLLKNIKLFMNLEF